MTIEIQKDHLLPASDPFKYRHYYILCYNGRLSFLGRLQMNLSHPIIPGENVCDTGDANSRPLDQKVSLIRLAAELLRSLYKIRE